MVVSGNRGHSPRLSTRGRAVPARRPSDQANDERQSVDIFLRSLPEVAQRAKSSCATFTNLCELPYSRNIGSALNIKRDRDCRDSFIAMDARRCSNFARRRYIRGNFEYNSDQKARAGKEARL